MIDNATTVVATDLPDISEEKQAPILEARLRAKRANDALAAAQKTLTEAQFAAAQAERDADEVHDRVLSTEMIARALTCEDNERKHHAHCKKHSDEVAARGHGKDPVDVESIKTITIDKSVHEVIGIEPLKLGHHGHGTEPRDASRFRAKCNLTVDTPHDELHAERFAQGAAVDCNGCLAAAPIEVGFNQPAKRN